MILTAGGIDKTALRRARGFGFINEAVGRNFRQLRGAGHVFRVSAISAAARCRSSSRRPARIFILAFQALPIVAAFMSVLTTLLFLLAHPAAPVVRGHGLACWKRTPRRRRARWALSTAGPISFSGMGGGAAVHPALSRGI